MLGHIKPQRVRKSQEVLTFCRVKICEVHMNKICAANTDAKCALVVTLLSRHFNRLCVLYLLINKFLSHLQFITLQ